MKATSFFAVTLVLAVSLLYSQSYAQSVGKAADKQKQANLEKNKAHQAELKKKYNSLSPEEAAQAKKRANEYKRNGGKVSPGTQTNSVTPSTKSTPVPANKPVQQPSGSKKTLQGIPVTNPGAKQPPAVKTNSSVKTVVPPKTTEVEKAPATKTASPAEKK